MWLVQAFIWKIGIVLFFVGKVKCVESCRALVITKLVIWLFVHALIVH